MQQAMTLDLDNGRATLGGQASTFGRIGRPGVGRAIVIAGLAGYAAVLAAVWWGVTHLLPDHVTLTLFGHTRDLKDVHQRIISNVALMLLILPSALWIECVAVGWDRSSARQLIFGRTRSINTDLACLFFGQAHVLDMLGRLMTLGASMLSGLWIRDRLAAWFGLSIDPSALPLVLQVVIFFFVYSFFDYWTHRLDHSRYFWPLHRYHHAADDFCVVNSTRTHPAAFTAIFLINMPMAVLGASPLVMVYVNVVTIALGFLIHSRIDSDFGWVGRWIIQSPNHHRLHHVLDVSEGVSHFGMAPVWDHLFGTWRGDADPSLVIGVETPYRHGFWIGPDLLRDYCDFWKGFVARTPAQA